MRVDLYNGHKMIVAVHTGILFSLRVSRIILCLSHIALEIVCIVL